MRFALLFLIACSSQSSHTSMVTASASGPIAGDGLDDLAALRNVLATSCDVHLGEGTFDVAAPLPRGYPRWNLLEVRQGCSLRGSGPGTILRFYGDASHDDWNGIGVIGGDSRVSDMTIDTSAIYNTNEQTHAILIRGTAEHVTVSGIWFKHPQRGGVGDPVINDAGVAVPMGGGDCIKVVSYDNQPSSVLVSGNHFIKCDRSGISSVGGFRGLVVDANTFYWTGDQDIDIEANNPGYEFVVSNNVFQPGGSGSFAVSLAAPSLHRFAFTGNVLNGRGMIIYAAKSGTISANTITSTQGGDNSIRVIKVSDDLTITGNTIVRTATAPPAAVLSLLTHNGATPGTVTIVGNILRNETLGATVINTQAKNLVLSGNVLEWRPPAGSTLPSITTLFYAQAIPQRIESMSITGNLWLGPSTNAVRLVGTNYGMGRVTLAQNVAVGPVAGFYCQQVASVPFGPFVVNGNNWPAPTSNSCTMSAGF